MPQHPEAILDGKKRPFTGLEFLESLRDGREIWIYGERVKDVTKHPAFRNTARMMCPLKRIDGDTMPAMEMKNKGSVRLRAPAAGPRA